MVDEVIRQSLLDDGHVVVGDHSAVHVCHWTKQSLRGQGVCFKEKFDYGVQSHRCMQMTPSAIYCTNSCEFCWCLLPGDEKGITWSRYPFPFADHVDSPHRILNDCVEERRKLVTESFSDAPDMEKFEEALMPDHAAVCLSGEPTLYPRLSELFDLIKQRGMSSHLVTNGTNPEALRNLRSLPDLLFVSLYAPDEATYERVCRPEIPDAWSRLMDTLQLLPTLPCKTVIELTLIRGLNMINPESYGRLIGQASPDFVDLKAFVPTKRSLRFLDEKSSPSWTSVLEFADLLSQHTGYAKGGEFPPVALQLVRT